jgi:MFS family permease
MSDLFARRAFRQLMIGQLVSSLGDWLGTIALIALVLDLSGSSTAVGGILVLRLAPSLVAGPLVTRLVGRWNRRRTMLAMDAARLAVVVMIPLVPALWWVYGWAFVLESAGLVFLPARDAAIPDLVQDGDLSLANGLVLGSSYGTIPLGAALFGLAGLFAAGRSGIALAFFVDAATFAVSYLLIRPIHDLDTPQQVRETETSTRFLSAFKIPFVRAFAPATVIATLGLGALFSVGIVFVREVLDASTGEFGVLIALFGVGAAIGLALLRFLGRDSVRVVRYGLIAQGIVIATMSLAPTLAFAFLGAALFGAATSTTLTASMSAVQELLPDEQRVTGFAAFHILIRVGLSLSAIGAGIAADVIRGVRWPVVGHLPSSRVVLLCSGIVVLLGATLLAPLLRSERFTAPATGKPKRSPSPESGRGHLVDLTLIAIEDEARDESAVAPARGRPVPGQPLEQHRDDDCSTRPGAAAAVHAPEQRHEHDVGGQAPDRGLAREPADDQTAEQRHGTRPRLGQQRSDRG